jgi:hypothetical protein
MSQRGSEGCGKNARMFLQTVSHHTMYTLSESHNKRVSYNHLRQHAFQNRKNTMWGERCFAAVLRV